MDFDKYLSYTTKQFLDDDDFVSWVINPTDEHNQFWSAFVKQHPDKKNSVAKAAKIVQLYRQQDTFFNEGRQSDVWSRIEASVAVAESSKKVFRLNSFIRAAAAIILVSACALAFWYYNHDEVIQTAYGEIKSVELPDHSTVILNGNSTLCYKHTLQNNGREVWLKGEAFFKVKHINHDTLNIKNSERFIVHADNLNVEVLGTSFNVRNRRTKVDVGLITGKIKVSDAKATSTSAPVIMHPGDYIQYAAQSLLAKSKLTHPEKLLRWSKRQFNFNNAKLVDIVKSLEDSYGYQIKFSNPKLQNLEIEGEINVMGVKSLLETISTSLQVNIYQNGNNITISQ
jgi:ferric-dicitrate binding protein FerR (iron transport regulator)